MRDGKGLRERLQHFPVRFAEFRFLRFGQRCGADTAAGVHAPVPRFTGKGNVRRKALTAYTVKIGLRPHGRRFRFALKSAAAPIGVELQHKRFAFRAISLSCGSHAIYKTRKCPCGFRIRQISGKARLLSKYPKHWQAVTTSNIPSGKPVSSAGATENSIVSPCFAASLRAYRICCSVMSAPYHFAPYEAITRGKMPVPVPRSRQVCPAAPMPASKKARL